MLLGKMLRCRYRPFSRTIKVMVLFFLLEERGEGREARRKQSSKAGMASLKRSVDLLK